MTPAQLISHYQSDTQQCIAVNEQGKEVRRIRMDDKLAEKELGWKAKAELKKGLKKVQGL